VFEKNNIAGFPSLERGCDRWAPFRKGVDNLSGLGPGASSGRKQAGQRAPAPESPGTALFDIDAGLLPRLANAKHGHQEDNRAQWDSI
jgi:hypothetical protein